MALRASTYVPKESPVHACSAGVKILLLLTYSISIFFVETWWGLLGFALISVLAVLFSRISLLNYIKPLIPVYFIMAFTIAFNWFFPGLFFALRIFLLALSSLVVCYTSTPTSLTRAFVKGLGPLRKIGLPADDIATTLGLALRFMPMLAMEAQSIRDAQWARGAAFDGESPFSRLKAWGGAFVPLFVGMFRKADRLAVAMDARCYGAVENRTSLSAKTFALKDAAVLFAGILLAILLGVFL